MSKHEVSLPLPEDLYADAMQLARMRRMTLLDLLLEALSDSVELQQQNGWIAERTPLLRKRPARPRLRPA